MWRMTALAARTPIAAEHRCDAVARDVDGGQRTLLELPDADLLRPQAPGVLQAARGAAPAAGRGLSATAISVSLAWVSWKAAIGTAELLALAGVLERGPCQAARAAPVTPHTIP